MKKTIIVVLAYFVVTASAQNRKRAKMDALYSNGYYVNLKGDTIFGSVQVNPEDQTEFYREFAFKDKRAKKPKRLNFLKVRAYGFDDHNFVAINYNGDKLFVERLTYGRLRFYEHKFNGKVNGNDAVESAYFIRDTEAEDASLSKPKKIQGVFYKKALKPYMKDQPMVWDDLDKYSFNKQEVLKAINWFNGFYIKSAD